MDQPRIHQCEGEVCQQSRNHPEKEHHHRMNVFFSRLDEQQKRWYPPVKRRGWYAALEVAKLGHGGQKLVSQITGLSIPTIQRGRDEMDKDLMARPSGQMRLPGGGRKLVEKNNPTL